MTSKVLVVLSGGQDSTTCLFWAKSRWDEVHALTINYGQRHARELEAATKIAAMAGVASHKIIDVQGVLVGRSPLVNPAEELEQYENAAQMDAVIGNRVELTFVPMRNTLFLTIAANHALAVDAFDLVTGVCQADNANYPDCRAGYVYELEQAFNASLGLPFDAPPEFKPRMYWAGRPFLENRSLRIWAPLMNLDKDLAIAHVIKYLDADAWIALAHSHTAYDGSYPPSGKDHATVLRAASFEKAGVPDPLILRATVEGLVDEWPQTDNYLGLRWPKPGEALDDYLRYARAVAIDTVNNRSNA